MIKDKNPVWWRWFPWILSLIVLSVGCYVWLRYHGRNFSPTNLYDLFPFLGISAFSLMWTHYAVGEFRRFNPALPKNELYSRISGILVFALILLHPGLLVLARYRDGAGLPPGSVYSYVGNSGRLAVTLGAIALVLFLSYDVFERLKHKSFVNKNWWVVNILQSIAMLFILKHSFTLGTHLQSGWFRTYWVVLGTLFLPMMLHVHWHDWKEKGWKRTTSS